MDIKNFLYDRLPELYRSYDANQSSPFPLKRYLEILTEGGLAELLKYIEALRSIQNIDECPKEFLPLVAQQYGLEFPYDMDENTQRKFIKILPKLYANKGTEESFKYLAREIFGEATNLKASMSQKPEGITDEEWESLKDWQKLLVYLEIDGETLKLDNKHINFLKFCELIRPVNTVVIPYLALFYRDIYDILNRANDIVNFDNIREKNQDNYNKSIQDVYDLVCPRESWADVYSKTARVSNLLNHSLLTNNFTLSTLGITDQHLDVLTDTEWKDVRKKFITDYSIDIFQDENTFSAIKQRIDESVFLGLKAISEDIRTKRILDNQDNIITKELSFDNGKKLKDDKINLDAVNLLDREEYTAEIQDKYDSIKISKQFTDVYKNAFYTRLNIKGELNNSTVTNASGFTDSNNDILEDLNIDYLRPTKEGSNLEQIIENSEELYAKSKIKTKSTSTFTRTREASLLNTKGLVLNMSFRTNDGNLSIVDMDY